MILYVFSLDSKTHHEKIIWNMEQPYIQPLRQLTNHMDPIFDDHIRSSLISYFPINFFHWLVGRALPEPIHAELSGIATAFAREGIQFDSLVNLNVFYELVTACTSIVARNPTDGRVILGRNLDWGGGLGKERRWFR